jgi:hypothetical protein
VDAYDVVFHPDYVEEFRALDVAVKEALGEVFDLLRDKGPSLGRPHVDTLSGSSFKNMKEIRVDAADGRWRIAFAFDHEQNAIIICGGDKSGVSQKRFYKTLIATADDRYTRWLAAE